MASQLTKSSPYSASFTGAGMMFDETDIIIPLLLENDSREVINRLRDDADILKIKAAKSRGTVTTEIVKRFHSMPRSFWEHYLQLEERPRKVALFYAILKTYRLLFEFQINLAIPKYNSPDRVLTKNDILMAFSEIASRDALVDSWSDNTRDRASAAYLSMLRKTGLINASTGELQTPPDLEDADLIWHIQTGEIWFLQACFYPGYKIEQLKQLAL